MVKNPPANAGNIRARGLIPGLGNSPGGGRGNHSSILAWRIPWTEELGGPQSMGGKETQLSRTRLKRLSTHVCKIASGKLLYNTGSSAWCSVMT